MRRLNVSVALLVLFVPTPTCFRTKTPEPIVRVDTVVVTREVSPVRPDGAITSICLSTGQNMEIAIAANGDTLLGPARVRKAELPGVAFAGIYAGDARWLRNADPLKYEGRTYTRTGAPGPYSCDDLKRVGEFDGIPLFAEVAAPSPLVQILVPVRPGIFQPYVTVLPRKR